MKLKFSIILVLITSIIFIQPNAFGQNDLKLNSHSSKVEKEFVRNDNLKTDKDHSDKIDKKLIEIISSKNPSKMAKTFGTHFKDNKLSVYVYLKPDYVGKIPKELNVLAKEGTTIVSKMSIAEMQQLAQKDEVRYISLPIRPTLYGHDQSEGVTLTFADSMHNIGMTGSGIKVAVIDADFFPTNPEIASNVIFSTLIDSGGLCSGSISCGVSTGGSHGTAVAENVVDMAPGVSLLLYTIGNSLDFNSAVDDAISRGANIITASLGFPTGSDGVTSNYRDGTSSVATKVNQAKNNGKLVTIAAGNEAQNHWQGTYSTSGSVTPASIGLTNYQSVMEFQPSASGALKACLPVIDNGGRFDVAWNDWTFTNQDYDVFLFNSLMTSLLASSISNQQGGIAFPIENLLTGGVGNSCLVIASWSSTQNHFFHVTGESGNSVQASARIAVGSIGTPADAVGALAVGAINQATNTLESFSSRGPTDDGRLKPEICGPDNVLTHQTSGLNPAFGTSFAAPHVAGAAALLLQQNPSLTASQLQQKLIDEALFNASYSINNLCGSNSGRVSLQIATITACVVPSSGDWIITSDCKLTVDATTPGNVIVQNNAVLTIPNGVSLNIDFTTKHLLVKSGSGVLIKAGGKIF